MKGHPDKVRFVWYDYETKYTATVESWLDTSAIKFTGCNDGWNSFYEYWKNDDEMTLGENYWCKVICERDIPIAVIAISLYISAFNIMEYIVAPERHGTSYGSVALKELLNNGISIIGKAIMKAEAVIYPNNIASQKVFEKCGFVFDHADPDGDAWHYKFEKTMSCFCGHDCSHCVTYLTTVNDDDDLRRQSLAFYRNFMKREIPLADIKCHGGRSDDIFYLCGGCPFIMCCTEKDISACSECRNQCSMFLEYGEKYVNKYNQI